MNIEVSDESAEDIFHRKRWTFWVGLDLSGTPKVFLNGYFEEERNSRRHKWRPTRFYAEFADRRFNQIRRKDVPRPAWVVHAALREAISQIEVDDWQEGK